jgi:hypothetical protein
MSFAVKPAACKSRIASVASVSVLNDCTTTPRMVVLSVVLVAISSIAFPTLSAA